MVLRTLSLMLQEMVNENVLNMKRALEGGYGENFRPLERLESPSDINRDGARMDLEGIAQSFSDRA